LKKFAIIVAAGSGKRFNKNFPKQFERLSGKPMLMYSIEAFHEAGPAMHIIVVIPKDFFEHWKELCKSYEFNIQHEVVEGGPERFHSVKNGLSLVRDEGLVAVHDGARPLIDKDTIKQIFKQAEKHGAVVPVIEVSDSVRTTDGAMHKPVDRKKLRLVQTPQVFRCSILRKAYQQQYDAKFTDDATVVEAIGERIVLVEGSVDNIKVTRTQDLIIAEAILEERKLKS
jgi:2-C-methyl-D-erythritol 4-phosphate cytidylyltransferase